MRVATLSHIRSTPPCFDKDVVQIVLYKPRGFVIWPKAFEYLSYSYVILNYPFVLNLLR